MSRKVINLEEEKIRLLAMSEHEDELHNAGYKLIGGIDEAGRGPLVGPVVAACVILKDDAFILGLNDSKKISESKREKMFEEIIAQSICYGIGVVNNDVIDEINILNATKMAMEQAVNNIKTKPDYLLIDHVKLNENFPYPYTSLVKGDLKSVSIAAASILAKVTRDRMLREIALEYPEYGFERNKGYGTKQHIEALLKHGPCPLHRKSFIRKYKTS